MIEETTKYSCRSCGSANIIRNGHNKCGNAQYLYKAYQTCTCYTDYWEAYTLFLPSDQHIPSGKGSGLTAHQERWYNTLRQWLGRYPRKSLSFSKEDRYLELVTRWFILEHNLRIQASLAL